jgi:copper(I)-binding protein
MRRSFPTLRSLAYVLIAAAISVPAHATQRAVRVFDAWVVASDGSDPMAGATVANGTMYDVYIVGAETEAAASVELVQMKGTAATPVKEVLVPAFDSLEFSPQGTHLILHNPKAPLKPGMEISLVFHTDAGERLTVTAPVRPKP